MTKIEHDVVLFAQCVAAAFKSPQHPRTAHGGCAGGHRALHMAARCVSCANNTLAARCSPRGSRGARASIPRRQSRDRRARVAAVKNCRKTHAFISSHRTTKKILSITTQQNMVDFDTIDKYVAAVKRGGVAIQMKQFHNLDRFIEEVVYDFKEYADIDLTEEQKEYIAVTVSGDESYEHLINKNGENEDLHVSFSDITQEYKAEKVPVYVETPNTMELARTLFHCRLENFDAQNHKSVMKYIKEAVCNNGNVEAIFEEAEIGERLGYGFRVYAKTESWTKLEREFRGAAQVERSVVVDMNNCHWSIWAWLYKDNKEISEGETVI